MGCQEGEEGPTLTGEWAGIRVRPLRHQASACNGVSSERAGDRGVGKLIDPTALGSFSLPSPVSYLTLGKQLCLAPWA